MALMEKLIALREQAGISQNGLAKAMGKSHSYVWNIEQGRKTLRLQETILAWAEALCVDPDEIYRAIGIVPYDITEQMEAADQETWDRVRQMAHPPEIE